jgi:replication-associated recombination protein RarA
MSQLKLVDILEGNKVKIMPKFDKNRMFEVASALQKEIRRGNEENAMYWGLELEYLNPSLLWNRLKIIASEDIGIANSFLSILIEILHKQYLEFKQREEKEGEEKGGFRLFLSHAILALCISPKSRIVDDFLTVVKEERNQGKKLEIPDYALDMHTARGKAKGRGMEDFLTEGTKLVNESKYVENPYKERVKELWLKHGKPLE